MQTKASLNGEIASVFDWYMMQFVYFLLPDLPLDPNGYTEGKGILSRGSTNSEQSVALEDCLPALPMNCMFLGFGDKAVGKIYTKKDDGPREDGRPLLSGTFEHDIISRENPTVGDVAAPNNTEENIKIVGDTSILEKLLPTIVGVSIGLTVLRNVDSSNIKNIMFAWIAGVGVGAAVGAEVNKINFYRGV